MADRRVVSLLNTPFGRYAWYRDFPARMTERLAAEGVRHVVGYKSIPEAGTLPEGVDLVVHDERDAPDAGRLGALLQPHLEGADRAIVHTHSYHFPGVAVWRSTRRRADTRWWATVHRTPRPGRPWARAVRGLAQAARLRFPDRLFGCSATAAAALKTQFPSRRVGVLCNGRLDGEALTRFEPRDSCRTAVLVGRLVRGKGVLVAAAAAERLRALVPGFRLVVVGDGDERARLEEYRDQRGLADVIEVTGYLADPDPVLRRADVAWVPTDPAVHQEGLPLVALEAMGHALPVIASRSGGLVEVVEDGVTGHLLEAAAVDDLVAATLALAGDTDRYHAMRRAVAAGREDWSLDRMIDDYLAAWLPALH